MNIKRFIVERFVAIIFSQGILGSLISLTTLTLVFTTKYPQIPIEYAFLILLIGFITLSFIFDKIGFRKSFNARQSESNPMTLEMIEILRELKKKNDERDHGHRDGKP